MARSVFTPDPARLFPFQEKWERPDLNPMPRFNLMAKNKRRQAKVGWGWPHRFHLFLPAWWRRR